MQTEVIHPNWPTMFPRLLTDGKLLDIDPKEVKSPILHVRNDIYSMS